MTPNPTNPTLPPLPAGWAWTMLGEVAHVNPQMPFPADFTDETPITFVPMAAVDEELGTIVQPESRPIGEVWKGYRRFATGDVLFAKITPCMENGKAAIASQLVNGIGLGSTEFHILRPSVAVLATWLHHFVRQRSFRAAAQAKMTGTAGQLRVSSTFMETVSIPLAPLAEQRRIVEAIEALFTQLEAGVAALKQARRKVRRYRASVLKAACEGRLVPQDPTDEPADVLLRRILAERRAKWEAEELTKLATTGKLPKDDRWKLKYRPPATPETDELALPELPESWQWATLGQVTWSVKDGPHYSPTYVQDGIPFISGGNVRPSGVDFENAKFITPELHQELSIRCRPEVGDILYTKGGTTGIARVNTYDREFSVWVHVAVLKLVDSINPFFVQHVLNAPFAYAQSQRYTHGVGNQDLGLTRMIKIVFALPPLAEQQRIVAEVERRLSVAAALEQSIDATLKRAERLRQSILKRAFSGQLVPQDPSDEPASALLARIRRERAGASQGKQLGLGV